MIKKLMRYPSSFNDLRTLRKDLRIRGCYKALSRKSEPLSFHTSKSISQKRKRIFTYEKNYEKAAILKFQRIFRTNFSQHTDKKFKGIK